MSLLQSTRRRICAASHTLGGVELQCGLLDHGGGLHLDTRPGIALWWMTAGTETA